LPGATARGLEDAHPDADREGARKREGHGTGGRGGRLRDRARIKALLRRTSEPPAPAAFQFGDVEADFARGELRRGGMAIELTPIEFKLLGAFVRLRGRVLSREQLTEAVWGPGTFTSARIVDNHIAGLRRKLGEDAADPRYIKNIRGLGYRFDG
jgi:two-component system alkaline phosphatase synthesis response regulator PhoP